MTIAYEHIPERDELTSGKTHLTSLQLMVLSQVDYERTLAPFQAIPENPESGREVMYSLADLDLVRCCKISDISETEDLFTMTDKGRAHLTTLCGVLVEE